LESSRMLIWIFIKWLLMRKIDIPWASLWISLSLDAGVYGTREIMPYLMELTLTSKDALSNLEIISASISIGLNPAWERACNHGLTLYEHHLYIFLFFSICTFHPHLLIKIWHSREPFPTVLVSKKIDQ
jgi:hypothetical protein